jgi:hypothetical protein
MSEAVALGVMIATAAVVLSAFALTVFMDWRRGR